jgi:hypothetical protein
MEGTEEHVSPCVKCALLRFCYGNVPYTEREHCGLFIPARPERPDNFFEIVKKPKDPEK